MPWPIRRIRDIRRHEAKGDRGRGARLQIGDLCAEGLGLSGVVRFDDRPGDTDIKLDDDSHASIRIDFRALRQVANARLSARNYIDSVVSTAQNVTHWSSDNCHVRTEPPLSNYVVSTITWSRFVIDTGIAD